MKVKVAQLCPTLCDPMDYSLWNSPGQNTGVGSLSLLYGIFPTQGLSPGLLHCSWILYQLNHKGSPRILEWAAYPFFSKSSLPRNWREFLGSPALQVDSSHLSHQGSSRILQWAAYPFSRGSSQPRDWTQVSPQCRRIFHRLSHQGRPRILEWAAYPFSSGSSRPRNHVYMLIPSS